MDFCWQSNVSLLFNILSRLDFPGGLDGKESAYNLGETQVQSLGWEDPLEKRMAIHFSILAWRIPQSEKPGRLESVSHKVRHD